MELTINGVRYVKGELLPILWVCYYPDGTRDLVTSQREISLLEEIVKLRGWSTINAK